MSAVPDAAPATPTTPARPLPIDLPLIPAVTRRRLAAVAAAYAVLWTVGGAAAVLGSGTTATLGAGLLLPGGGHLAHGQVLHLVLALVAFGLAVLVWWMVGAVVAPVLVWSALIVEGALTHSAMDVDPVAMSTFVGPAGAKVVGPTCWTVGLVGFVEDGGPGARDTSRCEPGCLDRSAGQPAEPFGPSVGTAPKRQVVRVRARCRRARRFVVVRLWVPGRRRSSRSLCACAVSAGRDRCRG